MRIFIAINIPLKIREKLEERQKEIEQLFDCNVVKWTKKECMHITLAFLGNIKKEDVSDLEGRLREVEGKAFNFFISGITYFPPERRKAKMIWAAGESKELEFLQKKVEEKVDIYLPGKNDFSPHITLGRIREWDLRRLSISQIPILEEGIDLNFRVDSFDLMESRLKRGGPEHKVISSFKLS